MIADVVSRHAAQSKLYGDIEQNLAFGMKICYNVEGLRRVAEDKRRGGCGRGHQGPTGRFQTVKSALEHPDIDSCSVRAYHGPC